MARTPLIMAPTDRNIEEAARLLRAGLLVAFPTETVYGLGADATNGRAVAAIFEAKGRPHFNPLIAHVADVAGAERIAVLPPLARRLAEALWPGPLTLVLPRAAGCRVSELTTAGLETIAVRLPSHPVARALLMACGCPVAAPSANRSGRVSATTAGHVAADLGSAVAMIIDGGATEHGVESTVVDLAADEPVLLRPGAVTSEELAHILGHPLRRAAPISERPNAPGRLESHYAPKARVRLGCATAEAGEALLGFGPRMPSHDGPSFNLSASGDLREAAANLFSALRHLDAHGVGTIAVMAIPEHGLGEAINDRLRRAAAPRD